MIHIEKDQEIFEDKNLRVGASTSDYEDSALIEVYNIHTPSVILGSFQAQYIKYGNLVYKFNDPRELGLEIMRIDPESTHTAASYVRMSNELLSQMNGGVIDQKSFNEAVMVEEIKSKTTILSTKDTQTSEFEIEDEPIKDIVSDFTPSVKISPEQQDVILVETPDIIEMNSNTKQR